MLLSNKNNSTGSLITDIQGGSKKVSCCTVSTAYFFWATLYAICCSYKFAIDMQASVLKVLSVQKGLIVGVC